MVINIVQVLEGAHLPCEFEAMADRMRLPAPRRPVFFDAVPPISGNLVRFIPARRSASSFAPGQDYDLDAVLTEAFDCADAALRGLELPWPVVHVRGASALPPGDLMEGLAAQDHLLEAQALRRVQCTGRRRRRGDRRRPPRAAAGGGSGR
ncbi:hypothetical protein ACFVJ5_05925 [Nocardia sp. NPDC127606]|uniref:hypothetical protein n=1 Tax=Nocardia sp. NPDC127606 TaxID=3345406 RepID=UPI003645253D